MLTSPTGSLAPVTGITNDISQLFDPETGVLVSGRSVTIAVRASSIPAVAGVPTGIADANGKPWTAAFADLAGQEHLFKVSLVDPDATLGLLMITLEVYTV